MNSKLLGAALTLCLAANAALAQDPTVVEPKHYILAFENDEVQVVDVHYGPHEKSKMHSHPGGVVVYVTEGHLKFTDDKGFMPKQASHASSLRSSTRWRTWKISRLMPFTLG
jgi:hypothetical protein